MIYLFNMFNYFRCRKGVSYRFTKHTSTTEVDLSMKISSRLQTSLTVFWIISQPA